jgi:hypothetical protein
VETAAAASAGLKDRQEIASGSSASELFTLYLTKYNDFDFMLRHKERGCTRINHARSDRA